MAKAGIYHHDGIIDNFELTTADITASTGRICNVFCVVKDSNDNCYIVCCNSSAMDTPIVLIKIDKNGNKTIAKLQEIGYGNYIKKVILSRDEQTLFFVAYNSQQSNYIAYSTLVTFTNGATEIVPTSYRDIFSLIAGMDIYQDRYIWTAHSTTVKVFNYDTKVLIDSETITGILTMCLSSQNVLYIISADKLTVCVLNTNIITKTEITTTGAFTNAQQMLIDKWGNLIILTNSGTNSHLKKYTTAGVLVDDIDLGSAFFNLDTKRTGEYYYSNDLHTYEIPKNTAQGQIFNTPVEINSTGMVTYNNNMTGYRPSIQA
jgi:hypothetical protein